MVTGGEEGTARKLGMDVYTLQCLKWVTSQDLLHGTWTSAACDVAAWMGWESGGDGYVYLHG